MRRSGVRIPSAPPPRHRLPPAGTVFFWFSRSDSRVSFLVTCAPFVPPTVEKIQSGLVCSGAEVVQVDVRGRNGGVPHPGLHGHRIYPVGQPEARGGVPEIMDPPAP